MVNGPEALDEFPLQLSLAETLAVGQSGDQLEAVMVTQVRWCGGSKGVCEEACLMREP